MATIELVPVCIHYTVSPKQVYARVRVYAGATAIQELTHPIPLDLLQKYAESAGRKQWTWRDVTAVLEKEFAQEGCLWGDEDGAAALVGDVADSF